MAVLIGTSGFSYEDWRGHFYPRALKKGDMLSFYARYFPAVEVNSTYYRLPTPATMFQMARKVPEGFRFVVKASAEMTHGERFDADAFARFRDAMQPLRDLDLFGGVLAQFPWSFQRTPENQDWLKRVHDELPGLPTVIEFRNTSWAGPETLDLLRSLDLGFCCVDEPRLKGLMPPVVALTSPIGYVRFHGRNAAKWWKHEHAYERYDYTYSEEELKSWVPGIQQLDSAAQTTYVFFNNHYEGQAGRNAAQLAALLNLPLPMPDAEPVQGTLAVE